MMAIKQKQYFHILGVNYMEFDNTISILNTIETSEPMRKIIYFVEVGTYLNNIKKYNIEFKRFIKIDNLNVIRMLALIYSYNFTCGEEFHDTNCMMMKNTYNFILPKKNSVLNWKQKSLKIIEKDMLRCCQFFNISVNQKNMLISILNDTSVTSNAKQLIDYMMPIIEQYYSSYVFRIINNYYLTNNCSDEDYVIIIGNSFINNIVKLFEQIKIQNMTVY